MSIRAFLFFVLIFQYSLVAQNADYSVAAIPKALVENADAVIRLDKLDITIASVTSMVVKKTRVITVFNESGMRAIDAGEYFEKSNIIKSIEAVVYDQFGKQIKKIKRKDFKETSISQGYTITDSRMLYMDYTPVQYPFTVVFTSERESENTAFIPQWSAVEGAYVSTEKSEINITCKPELGFRSKEYNFEGAAIIREQNENTLTYKAENIPASKKEDYMPSYRKISPYVVFALEKFNLEGVEGSVATWEDFGAWYYNNLLTGTDELPAETITKIKGLTNAETDLLKKAKIVYEYMQSKTRYVSI